MQYLFVQLENRKQVESIVTFVRDHSNTDKLKDFETYNQNLYEKTKEKQYVIRIAIKDNKDIGLGYARRSFFESEYKEQINNSAGIKPFNGFLKLLTDILYNN